MAEFKLKMQEMSEDEIQATAVDWFRKRWPHYHLHLQASQNGMWLGNHKNKTTRFKIIAKAKATGMVPGQSDLLLAVPKGKWHGFYIEVKRKGNKETDDQEKFGHSMRCTGYKYEVATGLDQLIELINEYMKLEDNF